MREVRSARVVAALQPTECTEATDHDGIATEHPDREGRDEF